MLMALGAGVVAVAALLGHVLGRALDSRFEMPKAIAVVSPVTDDQPAGPAVEAPKATVTTTGIDPRRLPVISLSARGASINQVNVAFNEGLHAPIRIQWAGSAIASHDFELKDAPFWEAAMSLREHGPIQITSSNRMQMSIDPPFKQYAIDGPLLAIPGRPRIQRSTASRPAIASLSIPITILVDPRLHVSHYKPLHVTMASDNGGRKLTPIPASPSVIPASSNQLSLSISFNATAEPGNLLSITLESGIFAVTSEQVLTIPDLQNNIPFSMEMESFKATVDRFDVAGNSIAYHFTVTPHLNEAPPSYANFVISDGTGRVVSSNTGTRVLAGNILGENFRGPFKLELRVPQKVSELPAKFELKDIPLN